MKAFYSLAPATLTLTRLALAALVGLAASATAADPVAQDVPPTIAIIIDDMGHNLHEGERLANLEDRKSVV